MVSGLLRFVGTVVLVLYLTSGCGTGERAAPADQEAEVPGGVEDATPPAPDTLAEDDVVEPAYDWTAGIVEQSYATERGPAILRDVRVVEHETFDRVVFEFEGAQLPGYHIEYIDEPVRECGSGEVVELPGDGWLEVRLTPARAHSETGEPTVEVRERAYELPVVKELELTCDFEANVTWVAGVSAPNRYRVLELSDPARLVVDVQH